MLSWAPHPWSHPSFLACLTFDVSWLLSLRSNSLQSYISILAAWRVIGRSLGVGGSQVEVRLQWLQGVMTVGRRLHGARGLEPGLVSRPTNGRENQPGSAPATARLLFKRLPPNLSSLWLCHAPSFPAFLVSPTALVPVAIPQRQSRCHGCYVPPRPAVSDP